VPIHRVTSYDTAIRGFIIIIIIIITTTTTTTIISVVGAKNSRTFTFIAHVCLHIIHLGITFLSVRYT